MSKYINKLISLVLPCAFCLGMASCGDFLDIEPKTFVSEDNFWNEKTDIDQMVAGAYVSMQSDAFIQRCIMWGETRSDNIGEGLNASGQTDIYRTLKENLMSTNAYTTWVDFYRVINQCNTIIEMAPVVSEKDPVYTESDVLATQAEMSGLRALCYFYLVRAFKDIPYYTYAIQSEDEVAPIAPSDGDSIVRCLIEDLEGCVSYALKAFPKSTNSAYDDTKNRITQNAIYAILTDLCLWDGRYDDAVRYAQIVIDSKYNEYQEDYANSTGMSSGNVALFQHSNDTYSKGFPLYPCYSGNTFGNDFDQIFGGNQNSFESIFELPFTYDGTNSNYLSNTAFATLYGNYYSSGGNNGNGYLSAADEIVSDVYNSPSGAIFDHRYDVRFYENISPESDDYASGYAAKNVLTSVSIQTSTSGSTLPYVADGGAGHSIYANRNFIFYRLTDVMLMQAEALIELGSNESTDEEGNSTSGLDDKLQQAFYIIWAVNRRSIMTNSTQTTSSYELTMNSNNNKSLLQDLVMKERRRELMFEGKRWFDLLRQCHRAGTTDYVKSRVSAKGSSGGSATLFTNYEALFWPYNKEEIKNNDLLSQKPYYGNDDDENSFSSTK